MRKTLAIFAALFAVHAFGSPIDYATPPPDDWPELRIEVVYGNDEQIKRWCARVPHSIFERVTGCAMTHFQWGLCMVFLSTQDPDHRKHEESHCKGYGHVGDTWTPAKAWEEFKTKHGKKPNARETEH